MDDDECPHGLGDPVGCLFCKRATRRALLRKADLPGVVVAEAAFDSHCPGCYGFIGLGERIFKLPAESVFVCETCALDA